MTPTQKCSYWTRAPHRMTDQPCGICEACGAANRRDRQRVLFLMTELDMKATELAADGLPIADKLEEMLASVDDADREARGQIQELIDITAAFRATAPTMPVGPGRRLVSAVEFNTSDYRFNHGAEPRGRGSWAFSFGKRQYDVDEVFWAPAGDRPGGSVTYGEAKRLARAEAIRRGFSGTIYVCS